MVQNQTAIVFTGKTSEYFGIWIVNLLLSIITFGIYSAWAKVRRKKYFYNNTLIEGVGFDYHASPIAILKGRIIAFILFVLFSVLAGLSPILYGMLVLAFIIALPWIIARGFRFNARNSSHRGLRFDFDGTYAQAALVFLAFPLLILITLGLALPFVVQRSHQFIVNHHKFGLCHFDMQASVKAFYMIYLKLLAAVILIGVFFGVGVNLLTKSLQDAPHASVNTHHLQQVSYQPHINGFIKVADVVMPAEAMPADQMMAKEPALTEEAYNAEDPYAALTKDMTPEEKAEVEKQMQSFEAQMNTETARIPAEKSAPKDPIEQLLGSYAAMLGSMAFVAILLGFLLYAVVIFTFAAYIQSRIGNLTWNNTKLEHIGFFSNQRMHDLVWLYLSNIVILVITLGLATPWVQIRMARYRISHLALTGETDWDKFVGEKKEASRALGEEIAEMFDVDLSFG